MYYSIIKDCDIADGEGVRVTLFVSGCTNKCPGCFQPETWNFCFGEPFTKATEDRLMKMLEPNYIKGLTLLGGDPMEPSNQEGLLPFVKRVRKELPEKNIWCYTGFTYEKLKEEGSHPRTALTDEFLSLLDVLVDGPFVEALKNPALRFRGSSNQRIIDVQKTLEKGEIVLMPYEDRVIVKPKD